MHLEILKVLEPGLARKVLMKKHFSLLHIFQTFQTNKKLLQVLASSLKRVRIKLFVN